MYEETSYADSCIGGTGCNDQMILNLYFHEVGAHILPRRYNYVPYRVNPGKECYPPTEVGDGLIFHFTGSSKPWVRAAEYEGMVDKGMEMDVIIVSLNRIWRWISWILGRGEAVRLEESLTVQEEMTKLDDWKAFDPCEHFVGNYRHFLKIWEASM